MAHGIIPARFIEIQTPFYKPRLVVAKPNAREVGN
jgi:hypothetical protein